MQPQTKNIISLLFCPLPITAPNLIPVHCAFPRLSLHHSTLTPKNVCVFHLLYNFSILLLSHPLVLHLQIVRNGNAFSKASELHLLRSPSYADHQPAEYQLLTTFFFFILQHDYGILLLSNPSVLHLQIVRKGPPFRKPMTCSCGAASTTLVKCPFSRNS